MVCAECLSSVSTCVLSIDHVEKKAGRWHSQYTTDDKKQSCRCNAQNRNIKFMRSLSILFLFVLLTLLLTWSLVSNINALIIFEVSFSLSLFIVSQLKFLIFQSCPVNIWTFYAWLLMHFPSAVINRTMYT